MVKKVKVKKHVRQGNLNFGGIIKGVKNPLAPRTTVKSHTRSSPKRKKKR